MVKVKKVQKIEFMVVIFNCWLVFLPQRTNRIFNTSRNKNHLNVKDMNSNKQLRWTVGHLGRLFLSLPLNVISIFCCNWPTHLIRKIFTFVSSFLIEWAHLFSSFSGWMDAPSPSVCFPKISTWSDKTQTQSLWTGLTQIQTRCWWSNKLLPVCTGLNRIRTDLCRCSSQKVSSRCLSAWKKLWKTKRDAVSPGPCLRSQMFLIFSQSTKTFFWYPTSDIVTV